MPKDLSKQYEKLLEQLIRAYSKRIQAVYHNAINEVTLFSALSSLDGVNPTLLNKSILDAFPALKNKFDQIMLDMHDGIYTNVARSINDSWELSNRKNDKIADDITKGTELATEIKELVYNPNADALQAFLKRKTKGMNLSDRVWKLVEPYKFELEAGLADGIGKGKSAAEMATDLKRNLKQPDKLFRRVRGEDGKLRLSRAAKSYHPGTGVYRSSYANALRLTANETNVAYKSSDYERWESQPFTKGIQVRVSNNHPIFDQCDNLAGTYPKDFKFVGWHVRCRCVATPLLVSDEEYDKQEDYLLGLTNKKPTVDNVKEIPEKAAKWIKDNAERIKGWKTSPSFIIDNKKYTKDLLKTKK